MPICEDTKYLIILRNNFHECPNCLINLNLIYD